MSDLAGAVVLVPRPAADDPFVVAVREAGGRPLPALLVRTVPAPSTALDDALRALQAGAHTWLAVTSAVTVDVIAERARALGATPAELTAGARVAAVGPATADALAAVGVRADLVPGQTASAEALLAAWPEPDGGSVLLPRSALAAPTLAQGLRARGWRVSDVVAYTTVPAPGPDPAVAAALTAEQVDAVLLTSGSVARALVSLYGRPPARTLLCAIGASTAAAAAAAGLTVAAVASAQSPAGLVGAVAAALHPTTSPTPPTPPTSTTSTAPNQEEPR
ncbi:uroporphyrinogen-III synthase [Georgenia muralis]|uniref:Uroporphyrinogen-III synthase n=1 Tax=Georgenia muralis TaxID=154117 RepID=A0A3N4YZT0_9MICO|nr:uroporphyrinogen-III synthase [Georgenia muralis]RPF26609.1 uroporphyrinogen-III synthase [Georgenia muralis]